MIWSVFFVENLGLEKKVAANKKVGDGFKIENDESPGVDDCSINLREV